MGSSWCPTAIEMFGPEPVDHPALSLPARGGKSRPNARARARAIQLSPSQQVEAERPPTPTTQQASANRSTQPCNLPGSRMPPFRMDASEPENEQVPGDGSRIPNVQPPQASASAREETLPRQRSKFLLSDHFGLIA